VNQAGNEVKVIEKKKIRDGECDDFGETQWRFNLQY